MLNISKTFNILHIINIQAFIELIAVRPVTKLMRHCTIHNLFYERLVRIELD